MNAIYLKSCELPALRASSRTAEQGLLSMGLDLELGEPGARLEAEIRDACEIFHARLAALEQQLSTAIQDALRSWRAAGCPA